MAYSDPSRRGTPHPVARGVAAALGFAGALLLKGPLVLFAGWLVILLLAGLSAGVLRAHLRFVLVLMLPIAISLFFVWGWLVAAPPGSPPGSAPVQGREFALTVALRLVVLGGTAQLAILTIPTDELAYTLRRWGLRGDMLIIALGSFALAPELKRRANEVLTARFARGLGSRSTLSGRIGQIPHLLRPLLAWVLRSAIQRSEVWQHRQLLSRVEEAIAPGLRHSRAASFFIVALAGAWFVNAVLHVWL